MYKRKKIINFFLKILEEKAIWSQKWLKLNYLKFKCFNYQVAAECKICIKKHKYNIYKISKK